MIIALLQQCLIFFIIYYHYSDDCERNFDSSSKMHSTNVEDEGSVVSEELLSGMIINGRFEVGDFLGGGYTGFVRNGTDTVTGKPVAIKFARSKLFYSLEREYKNYLHLGADDPTVIEHGIPHILHFGDFAGYKVLVMTKTGPSLHYLRGKTRFGKFGIKTLSKIAIQGIRIFKYIHSRGLLFHDVKPANMAIGDGPEHQHKIFFYDFAFSEQYMDAMGVPKQRETVDGMDGTPNYFSIEVLHRQSHVRKDELFAFGVCLLDLNNADLPWLEMTDDISDIFNAMDVVLQEWEKHGIEAICNTSDRPEVFLKYFNYIESIDSTEEPNYDQLIELFINQLTAEELNDPNLGILDVDHEPDKVELEAQLMGKVINGRFEIKNYRRKEFAVFVHNGIDLETNTAVDIKFGTGEHEFWFKREYKNFQQLKADDISITEHGIPHMLYFGTFKKYDVFVMTKTGPTLENLWFDADRKLAMDFVRNIAIKAIRAVEYIHSKGLVVCDIKPSTVAIGDGNASEIFFFSLVFGESYANAFDFNMQRLQAKNIRGTPEYMSVGMLSRLVPVPKDDLISLGIVLMQLNGAHIPWMNKTNGQIDLFERLDIILREREEHPIKEVCSTTDNPKLFEMYFEQVNGCNAHEKLNYDQLVELFTTE